MTYEFYLGYHPVLLEALFLILLCQFINLSKEITSYAL